ncbi:MAG: hypothetical protein ACREWI_11810, partial [Telluria sp.]
MLRIPVNVTADSGIVTADSGIVTTDSGIVTVDSGIVTADSGIVTADSGKPGKSVTFVRNRRSRWAGISRCDVYPIGRRLHYRVQHER